MENRKLITLCVSGVAIFIAVIVLLATCVGPQQLEVSEEVSADDTAFLVPLEEEQGGSGSDQMKFGSLQYLEQKKIAAKRVIIPQRKLYTGRFPGSYKWIPSMRLIKVDRTQVTRAWTKDAKSGTSTKDQAIRVESGDSINFAVGVTIGVTILEEDTAKYLYFFASKTLSDMVDTNIRGYCQSVLGREFGKTPLMDCPMRKDEAFKLCFEETRKFYKEKGITVDYLGTTEGLIFDDKKIQDQFDRQFTAQHEIKVAQSEKLAQDERNTLMKAKLKAEAETKIEAARQDVLAQEERNKITISKAKTEAQAQIETAKQEALAQAERNKMLVEKARAEREAAEEMAKAKEGLQLKSELEIRKIQAEAQAKVAERWQGTLPIMLPQTGQYFFGMDNILKSPLLFTTPSQVMKTADGDSAKK